MPPLRAPLARSRSSSDTSRKVGSSSESSKSGLLMARYPKNTPNQGLVLARLPARNGTLLHMAKSAAFRPRTLASKGGSKLQEPSVLAPPRSGYREKRRELRPRRHTWCSPQESAREAQCSRSLERKNGISRTPGRPRLFAIKPRTLAGSRRAD